MCLSTVYTYSPYRAVICPTWTFVCPQALVIAGISLQTANLYGYIHCKLGRQKSTSRVTSRFFLTADVPKSKYRVGLSATAHEVSPSDLPHVVGFGSPQVLVPKVTPGRAILTLESASCRARSEGPHPMSLCSGFGACWSFRAELLPRPVKNVLSEPSSEGRLLRHRSASA